MGQIRREIEETGNAYLFKAYNPVGTSHVIERHMEISRRGLEKRLAKVDFDRYGCSQSMSRFLGHIPFGDICGMVCKCLGANEKHLRVYLAGSAGRGLMDFYLDFPSPIGEGLVKGLDGTLHKMSRICVVVGHSGREGRKLEVISAYPVFGIDEIDAIDELLEQHG